MVRRGWAARATATLVGTALLLTAGPARPHLVLDGEVARPLLADIARALRASEAGAPSAAGAEALYTLGERVQQLVELMNHDLVAHGESLYAELVARRLLQYGVQVRRREGELRYRYDLAAFREYLRRAPDGARAADAKFQLIAAAFYGSVGRDEAELVGTDLEGLRQAITAKERFLDEHPQHGRTRDVRFFLAVDYYRMATHSPDPEAARRYARLASRALQAILQRDPGTAEARTAEVLLGKLRHGPGR